MTPALRRAFHQALDLVLDAMADEARNDNARPKRKRVPAVPKPLPPLPSDVTPDERAAVRKHLERSGFRKTG